MELTQLNKHLRTLIALKETETPVLSCHLYLGAGKPAYRDALDGSIAMARTRLGENERGHFDAAIGQVEAFLAQTLLPSARGAAVFARGGRNPLFLALQFRVPLPNRLIWDQKPHIYPLVDLKDKYHRYVVMISTEEQARILEVSLGEVTKELTARQPDLQPQADREWIWKRRLGRTQLFIREKTAILDRLMTEQGHTHLILVGHPRITADVRDRLPKHLSDRVIDIIPVSARHHTSDILAATLSSFLEHEQKESLANAKRLKESLGWSGLAVAKTGPCLQALVQGQVDVLVMASAYDPRPGWSCRGCGTLDAAPKMPIICAVCDDQDVYDVDLKEEMVRLAEKHRSQVEIVRHCDDLLEVGGVGCLLRYPMPAFAGSTAQPS